MKKALASTQSIHRIHYYFFATILALALPLTQLEAAMSGEKSHKDMMSDETFSAALASNLVGEDILDKNGEQIGKVADFAVTFGDTGRVTHVIVGSGIFPAFGDPQHAIPASLLTWNDGDYHLDATKETFQKTESIKDPRSWINDKNALNRLDRHYNISTKYNESRHFMYRDLDTNDVVTQSGREIGRVTDVLVSLDQEIMPYILVVPTDPFLSGNTGKRYGIPVSDISNLDSQQDFGSEIRISTDFNSIMTADSVESSKDLSLDNNKRGIVIRYEG